MAQVGDYGGRTAVVVMVERDALPRLSVRLHSLLGVSVRGDHPRLVFLPGDTRSFGLVAGAAGRPAQGSLSDMYTHSITRVHTEVGTFWGVPLSHFGSYFGWSDPTGVRVEFHTLTGETYAVTISYDSTPGTDEALKLALVETLLLSGNHSVARALTPAAADRWVERDMTFAQLLRMVVRWIFRRPSPLKFDSVQLSDPEPQERIVMRRPDSQDKGGTGKKS